MRAKNLSLRPPPSDAEVIDCLTKPQSISQEDWDAARAHILDGKPLEQLAGNRAADLMVRALIESDRGKQPDAVAGIDIEAIGIETGLKKLAIQRGKKLSRKDKREAVFEHLLDVSNKLASPNNNEIGRAIWKSVNENGLRYAKASENRDRAFEAFRKAGPRARKGSGKKQNILRD